MLSYKEKDMKNTGISKYSWAVFIWSIVYLALYLLLVLTGLAARWAVSHSGPVFVSFMLASLSGLRLCRRAEFDLAGHFGGKSLLGLIRTAFFILVVAACVYAGSQILPQRPSLEKLAYFSIAFAALAALNCLIYAAIFVISLVDIKRETDAPESEKEEEDIDHGGSKIPGYCYTTLVCCVIFDAAYLFLLLSGLIHELVLLSPIGVLAVSVLSIPAHSLLYKAQSSLTQFYKDPKLMAKIGFATLFILVTASINIRLGLAPDYIERFSIESFAYALFELAALSAANFFVYIVFFIVTYIKLHREETEPEL